MLYSKDFPKETTRTFEKIIGHYNDLLMNSHPQDQEAALENTTELLKHPLEASFDLVDADALVEETLIAKDNGSAIAV